MMLEKLKSYLETRFKYARLFEEDVFNENTSLLSTAECNNRLPCSARLVYSSQYNDQKVRHVVYLAQYVILKRK